ncbi:MAG: DUF2065 domain-containing protein [Thermodesulfobacteriota bacterium]
MDYKILLVALGLVFMIEGFPWAAFPGWYREMVRQILEISEATQRIVGLLAMALGLFLVWLGVR